MTEVCCYATLVLEQSSTIRKSKRQPVVLPYKEIHHHSYHDTLSSQTTAFDPSPTIPITPLVLSVLSESPIYFTCVRRASVQSVQTPEQPRAHPNRTEISTVIITTTMCKQNFLVVRCTWCNTAYDERPYGRLLVCGDSRCSVVDKGEYFEHRGCCPKRDCVKKAQSCSLRPSRSGSSSSWLLRCKGPK